MEKALWTEDDCTRNTDGHEYVGQAWERLFGEPLNFQVAKLVDHGDCTERQMPNGHSVWSIYGAWDEIRKTVQ